MKLELTIFFKTLGHLVQVSLDYKIQLKKTLMKNSIIILCLLLFNSYFVNAQWKNRYQKVDGYGHHVYLEGYELPVLSSGPMDPAPSPANDKVAFSLFPGQSDGIIFWNLWDIHQKCLTIFSLS